MLYKRKGTQLFYDVTNPDLLPLYENNPEYELVEPAPEKAETKPKKTKK